MLEEYFKGDVDIVQAVDSYKEHKIPDKFSKDVVVSALTLTVDKTGIIVVIHLKINLSTTVKKMPEVYFSIGLFN